MSISLNHLTEALRATLPCVDDVTVEIPGEFADRRSSGRRARASRRSSNSSPDWIGPTKGASSSRATTSPTSIHATATSDSASSTTRPFGT